MLTLQQTLEDQKDIIKLCQPCLENRYELYSPNDNYGFAHVMKSYADYPVADSIYATFPHGMYMRDKVVSISELEADFPNVLNYPPFTTPLWKKAAKTKKIIPFAAPIHYALKVFQSEVTKSERRGTLFLPMHSTKMVEINFDRDAVLAELQELPDEFKPITICLHWQDIEKGLHIFFRDKGFDVVCAGHFTDCDYIFRWLHLISQYKLVAHCGFGSALFYSVLAGVPFYLTKEQAEIIPHASFKAFHKDSSEYTKSGLGRLESLRRIFSVPVSKISREQKDLVNLWTHAHLVKKPDELKKLFQSLKASYLEDKVKRSL
tara:strand:+ start:6651 stop:7607 length:957 start_codon:yes stop_codon:yes gene_type:complete